MKMISRRQFVKDSLLAASAAGLAPRLRAATTKKLPVAVQLYSVRDVCAKDFDGALGQLAKMGFDGVEFAGYHSYSGKPKALRQRLDDLNLRVAATHLATMALRGDALKQTIEFHQTIGCRFLIVPNDRDFTDPEKSKVLAETFNQVALTLKPLGMACGYHNHASDFKMNGGKTSWDWFAERTSQDVILQQDCGWTVAAGYDPVVLMKRYPGRMRTTHFKPVVVGGDQTKKPIIGQDSVDWPAVLAACIAFGGTEWITVEQEKYLDGISPMACTEMSLAGLKKITG